MSWLPDCLRIEGGDMATAVPSQRGLAVYVVQRTPAGWECTCPDWFARGARRDCKHIVAAVRWLKREGILPPLELRDGAAATTPAREAAMEAASK